MTARPRSLPSARLALVAMALLASAGCRARTSTEREAATIAEKNAAARGGLDAWRRIRSLSMSGTLEAGTPRDPVKLAMAWSQSEPQRKAAAREAALHGGARDAEKQVTLPFVMELKRPRKTRLEVRFHGQTAVQVYDGASGWKLRPFLGRWEWEPYSAEELRVAAQQTDLDGPLLDWEAKGEHLDLEGIEPVDGRDAYKLKVTSRNGQIRHVWVDKETHLDVKVEGSRRMDGKPRPVFTYLRDYRTVDGLKIPHLLETVAQGVNGSEKIVVQQVSLNPKLDNSRFVKVG